MFGIYFLSIGKHLKMLQWNSRIAGRCTDAQVLILFAPMPIIFIFLKLDINIYIYIYTTLKKEKPQARAVYREKSLALEHHSRSVDEAQCRDVVAADVHGEGGEDRTGSAEGQVVSDFKTFIGVVLDFPKHW